MQLMSICHLTGKMGKEFHEIRTGGSKSAAGFVVTVL
jgi:hypothetical protein